MNEERMFFIHYDDQPNDVIDVIAGALLEFGLDILEVKSADGYIEYKIINKNEQR